MDELKTYPSPVGGIEVSEACESAVFPHRVMGRAALIYMARQAYSPTECL